MPDLKGWGFEKRATTVMYSKSRNANWPNFQMISFGSIIRNLITFEMTSSEIGTVSVRCFIVIQCTVKTY